MGFVGNLPLFAAAKEFCKSIKDSDKVIAVVRVAHFFDSHFKLFNPAAIKRKRVIV